MPPLKSKTNAGEEIEYRAADGTTKRMPASKMAEELRRQQDLVDGNGVRREEGSGSIDSLRSSNPRLAAHASLAKILTSRLDLLAPPGPLELVSATNWPDESKRMHNRKQTVFRLAPTTNTHRIVVKVKRKNAIESYAIRATSCGDLVALRAAWALNKNLERIGPKLKPTRDPHLALLLRASLLYHGPYFGVSTKSLASLIAGFFFLFISFLIYFFFRRRRTRSHQHNNNYNREEKKKAQ